MRSLRSSYAYFMLISRSPITHRTSLLTGTLAVPIQPRRCLAFRFYPALRANPHCMESENRNSSLVGSLPLSRRLSSTLFMPHASFGRISYEPLGKYCADSRARRTCFVRRGGPTSVLPQNSCNVFGWLPSSKRVVFFRLLPVEEVQFLPLSALFGSVC